MSGEDNKSFLNSKFFCINKREKCCLSQQNKQRKEWEETSNRNDSAYKPGGSAAKAETREKYINLNLRKMRFKLDDKEKKINSKGC